MPGHLFVINGDLTRLACDAVLIPTDSAFSITASWKHAVRPGSYVASWGGSDQLRIATNRGEPDVWLGNVGLAGNDSDFTSFADAAKRFVVAAVEALDGRSDEERIYPWPKRRLAVNLIGSGYGGARNKKGQLAAGLIPTLQELAVALDVDIVLVMYGTKPYAAAQRARRRLVDMDDLGAAWTFQPESNPELHSKAQSLAAEAVESQLVLFMGAGVSAGAGLPTWNEMLGRAAFAAGVDLRFAELLAKYDPRDQATVIESRFADRDDLRESIARDLQRFERYSLAHGLLASLPSKEAVTTNYDELFEVAANIDDRRLAVLPESPRETNGHWLLKLHGSVTNPSRLVLTRSDYLNMPRQYGALMGLVQALLMMRHMLFVGYSLSDEDFHELVHEIRSARGDSSIGHVRSTVLTLTEDPVAIELWSGDLDIVPMTMVATEVPINVAARELDIFLDLVGFLSTTSAAFFLDESYSELTVNEESLRAALTDLVDVVSCTAPGDVGYIVRGFLRSLGGP